MSEAKKAPVENIAKAMDILEALMDAKKVIQCKAMIIPAIENLTKVLNGTLSDLFFSLIKRNINIPAMVIRNQTKGIASIEISSPKIAVNPAMNTSK